MSDPDVQIVHHIFNNTHIRTCLQIGGSVEQLLVRKPEPKWTCLRSLDLSYSRATSLPESIDQLLHLRSLNLSFSSRLKVLPKSITKLINLQTLNLYHCTSLKQLPDDVSKLVDLSTLDIAHCSELSFMPVGIGLLTCLQTLCQFVVGAGASSTSMECFSRLEDLQHLNKLKGRLKIQLAVLKNAKFVKEEHGGLAYLRSKEHLEMIVIIFRRGEKYGSEESEQALLEEMQPHHNVKTLRLKGYHGETIPRWRGRGTNSTLFDLPNLVTLKIQDCVDLLYLPWQIGKLPHLKTLNVSGLLNMEYVTVVDSDSLMSGEVSSFFPNLVNLNIFNLPELKGWWRRSESGSHVVNPNDTGSSQEAHLVWLSSPCFPQLKNLIIKHCDNMMFVPLCPQLEHLDIYDSRRKFLWTEMRSNQASSSLSYSKSRRLEINNLKWLKSMPIKYSEFLAEIYVKSDIRSESLGEVEEFPTGFSSSLRILRIDRCPKLKSMRGWLDHLFAMESLHIQYCPNVVLGEISWDSLSGSLQSLDLIGFKEMEELPEGMQYCTSLQSLFIWHWHKLKFLPKWMPKLTSLQTLQFLWCSKTLMERCQQPYGRTGPSSDTSHHLICGFPTDEVWKKHPIWKRFMPSWLMVFCRISSLSS